MVGVWWQEKEEVLWDLVAGRRRMSGAERSESSLEATPLTAPGWQPGTGVQVEV